MKNHKLLIATLLTVLLCTVSSHAQMNLSQPITAVELSPSDSAYLEQYRIMDGDQRIARAWRHTVGRNSYSYPNPDSVLPGDELLTPLGTYCIAESGGTKHMWRAAELFVATIVNPYFNGTLPTPPLPEPDTLISGDTAVVVAGDSSDLTAIYWLAGILILVALGILLFSRYNDRQRKQMEDDARAETAKREYDRKFVPEPPDFKTVSTDEANRTATTAAQSVFGRGVEIVGDIERGYITGTQVMFNADGTSCTETFSNEPGYRATVRFADGTERLVVCRWACFNPCYSSTGAEFTGTFRPSGSKTAEEIPRITADQTTALEQSIKGSEDVLTADDVPQTEQQIEEAAETSDATPEADGKLHLTEVMISKDKGVKVVGPSVILTFDELLLLTSVATGNPIPKNTDNDSDESK